MKQTRHAQPPGFTPSQEVLWQKIQEHRFDDPDSAFPFSARLAAEEGWDHEFAALAIEEYRKFIFLCCIAPEGAAPSAIVDKVWHLHLTYTVDYWEVFCAQVLGRKLHHYPSKGGRGERQKHTALRNTTLALYKDIFGAAPPAALWSMPAGWPGRALNRVPEKTKLRVWLLLPLLLLAGCSEGAVMVAIAGLFLFALVRQIFKAAGEGEASTTKKTKQEQQSSCSGGGSDCGSSDCGCSCGGCSC